MPPIPTPRQNPKHSATRASQPYPRLQVQSHSQVDHSQAGPLSIPTAGENKNGDLGSSGNHVDELKMEVDATPQLKTELLQGSKRREEDKEGRKRSSDKKIRKKERERSERTKPAEAEAAPPTHVERVDRERKKRKKSKSRSSETLAGSSRSNSIQQAAVLEPSQASNLSNAATINTSMPELNGLTDSSSAGNSSSTPSRLMTVQAPRTHTHTPVATPLGATTTVPEVTPSKHDKADYRIQKLERKLERKREDHRLKEKELEAKIAMLENAVREKEGELVNSKAENVKEKERADDNAKKVAEHLANKDSVKEMLEEAVSCLICSDTLHDPHILACGHIACKKCLQSWFRQPNAYCREIPGPITPSRDLSYRSKVCHVCRSVVLRRPTRMYNLYAFLEPLGIISNIPTASQEASDPWDKTFPPEKESYRLYDEGDGAWRCPNCFHEIWGSECPGCSVEFSGGEDEDEDGWETDEAGWPNNANGELDMVDGIDDGFRLEMYSDLEGDSLSEGSERLRIDRRDRLRRPATGDNTNRRNRLGDGPEAARRGRGDRLRDLDQGVQNLIDMFADEASDAESISDDEDDDDLPGSDLSDHYDENDDEDDSDAPGPVDRFDDYGRDPHDADHNLDDGECDHDGDCDCEDESEYGGSFIDDGDVEVEDDDGDLPPEVEGYTGSGDDVEDSMSVQHVDVDVDEDDESQDEDEHDSEHDSDDEVQVVEQPDVEEMRRRRLQRLAPASGVRNSQDSIVAQPRSQRRRRILVSDDEDE